MAGGTERHQLVEIEVRAPWARLANPRLCRLGCPSSGENSNRRHLAQFLLRVTLVTAWRRGLAPAPSGAWSGSTRGLPKASSHKSGSPAADQEDGGAPALVRGRPLDLAAVRPPVHRSGLSRAR